jgi:hypothetical protein
MGRVAVWFAERGTVSSHRWWPVVAQIDPALALHRGGWNAVLVPAEGETRLPLASIIPAGCQVPGWLFPPGVPA